jgi:hypothetical protein
MKGRRDFLDDLKKLHLSNDITKELVLVHGGVKPSIRIVCPDSDVKSFKELLGEHGLHIAESRFKVISERDRGKGCFSNKARGLVSTDSKEGDMYYYVARSGARADEARDVEFLDSRKFGRLLGYPDCCREFHMKYFPLANEKQGDLILYTLSETEEEYPYDFYNNYATQYFDYFLLSHFTCSFNCKKSSVLAKRYYAVLRNYSRKWADRFLYYQRSAIIYTEYEGVFLLKGFNLDENVLRFDDSCRLYSTAVNNNMHLLEKGDNISIKSKNNFSIRRGDKVLKTFRGENVGLMVFG